MTITRRFTLGLLLGALSGGWASAKGLDEPLLEQLDAQLNTLRDHIVSGRFDRLFDLMPPALLRRLCKAMRCTREDLEYAARLMLPEVLTEEFLSEIEYVSGLRDARYEVSPTGRPYLVMQSMVRLPEGARFWSPNVALLDGGTWYIVRIDNPRAQSLLTQVYPDLKGLNLEDLSKIEW